MNSQATSLLPRASQQLGAMELNSNSNGDVAVAVENDYNTYYAKLVKLASSSSSTNTKSASSLLTTSSSYSTYNSNFGNFDTTPLTTSCYTANTDEDEHEDFMSMLNAQAQSTHLNRRQADSNSRRQIVSSSNLSTFKSTQNKHTTPSLKNNISDSNFRNYNINTSSNSENMMNSNSKKLNSNCLNMNSNKIHNLAMTTPAQSEALQTSSWLQAQQSSTNNSINTKNNSHSHHNFMHSFNPSHTHNTHANTSCKNNSENYYYYNNFQASSDNNNSQKEIVPSYSRKLNEKTLQSNFQPNSKSTTTSPLTSTENSINFKIHNSNSASILLNKHSGSQKKSKLSSKKFSIDSNPNNFGQSLSIELACDNAAFNKSPPQGFIRKYSKEDINARSPQLHSESSSPNSIFSKLSSLAVTMQKSNNNLMNNIASKTTQLFNRNRKGSDCNNSNNTLISVSSSSTSSSSPISNKSANINFTPATATASQSSVPSFTTEFTQPKWNYDESENYWYSNGNNVQMDMNLAKVNCLSGSSRGNLAVRLDRIDIKNLTILELNFLKKICIGKLQQISDSQLQLSIPKDESIKSIKQSHFTLRSKSVAFKLALYDDLKLKKNQTKDQQNLVFGQTIYKCILNDMCKKKNEKFLLSLKNIESCDLALSKRNNKSLYSKLNDDKMCKRNSVLFEALDLSSVDAHQIELKSHVLKQATQVKETHTSVNFKVDGYVPEIVKQCCMHIEKYGLQTIGIFRIDSSKKRIKEIKELFDRGQSVELDGKYNPLDVACLLKDYLRSLPEPLLTRKLYNAFIYCSKVKDNLKKLELMRYLICLLPVPNRDTLQMILKLLDNLKSHCTENANKQKSGNKMDSFNLAMVFGPNILQKRKQLNNKEFAVDKNALVDDIEAVISVTKFLIDNTNFMFHIDNYLHNEVVKKVYENCPSELNSILMKKIMESIGVITYDSESQMESGYSSVNTRSTTTTDESSSSELCQSSNELDKLNSLKNSPRPFMSTSQEPITTTFSYQETSSDSSKENDRYYNFEQICANINAEARSRTTSTPPLALQTSNSNTCLSIPYRSSSNLKKTTIKTYKQNSSMLKGAKPLAVNKNVYIKNRAYFPISHMNKNLINNLNEENNTIKRETTEKLNKTLSSQNSLLMIQTNNGQQQHSLSMKTKSLVNLNSFPYNEPAVNSSSDLKKPANMDTIHFIGEQETLV